MGFICALQRGHDSLPKAGMQEKPSSLVSL